VDKSKLGAFADYAAVNASLVAKKPVKLDFVQAAGLSLAGLTALRARRDELGVASGDRQYISGGVGTMAIQIAKWMGAQVATTASPVGDALVRGRDPSLRDDLSFLPHWSVNRRWKSFPPAFPVRPDRGRVRLPRTGPRPRQGNRPDGMTTSQYPTPRAAVRGAWRGCGVRHQLRTDLGRAPSRRCSARLALSRAMGFAVVLRSAGSPGRRGAGCGS
jgi:hypothetical protein